MTRRPCILRELMDAHTRNLGPVIDYSRLALVRHDGRDEQRPVTTYRRVDDGQHVVVVDR